RCAAATSPGMSRSTEPPRHSPEAEPGRGRPAVPGDAYPRCVTDSEDLLARAHVDPEVVRLCPDYRALLIVLDGLAPAPGDATSEALLVEAEQHAQSLLAEQAVDELPHIQAWRAAYRQFGAKPQRTRNSLEAL